MRGAHSTLDELGIREFGEIEMQPRLERALHVGVCDNRDSRTRFMQQLGPIIRAQPTGLEGEIVPPVHETVGDIAFYGLK